MSMRNPDIRCRGSIIDTVRRDGTIGEPRRDACGRRKKRIFCFSSDIGGSVTGVVKSDAGQRSKEWIGTKRLSNKWWLVVLVVLVAAVWIPLFSRYGFERRYFEVIRLKYALHRAGIPIRRLSWGTKEGISLWIDDGSVMDISALRGSHVHWLNESRRCRNNA